MVILVAVAAFCLDSGRFIPSLVSAETSSPPPTAADLSKLNLRFVPNQGQYGSEVKFASNGSNPTLRFMSSGITIDSGVVKKVNRTEPRDSDEKLSKDDAGKVAHLNFLGSNSDVVTTGEEEKAGKVNCFIGDDPANWRTGVGTYGKVRYSDLYPGIDAVFYGTGRQIQYDFIVAPYADPKSIAMSVRDFDNIRLDRDGSLIAKVGDGELSFSRPVLYQTADDGKRLDVEGSFALTDRKLGFKIGDYDRSRVLVIDPVLSYSTFLGGSFEDVANAVAVDAQGNTYVTGYTKSLNFPVSEGGGQRPNSEGIDAFVTKINAAGDDIVYSSIFGGGGDDIGNDIKVDQNGQAYVVGVRSGGFPQYNSVISNVTSTFRSAQGNGAWEAVRGLNQAPGCLVAHPTDPATAFAGTNGRVYKTTDSGVSWQPTTSSVNNTFLSVSALAVDAVNPSRMFAAGLANGVKVFKTTDGGLSWSPISFTFEGTTVRTIAINPHDPQSIYLGVDRKLYRSTDGGTVWEALAGIDPAAIIREIVFTPDLPAYMYVGTSRGLYRSANGGDTWLPSQMGGEAFKILIEPGNSPIVYVASLGSVQKSFDRGHTWTTLSQTAGSAVLGFAQNPDHPLHMFIVIFTQGVLKSTNGGQTWTPFNTGINGLLVETLAMTKDWSLLAGLVTGAGGSGGFAMKLNAAGDHFIYSTLVGEENTSVAVDNQGRAYVAGSTDRGDLPLVNPIRPYSARNDGYVALIDAVADNILFSTYLGGGEDDFLNDVDVDSAGNIYLTGQTWSPDFPLFNPRQSAAVGQNDVFVTKLQPMGTGYVYSTRLGGTGNELAQGIAADSQGNAYVVGTTGSTDFPAGIVPRLKPYGGATEAFISKLGPSGADLIYSHYIGGTEGEDGEDVVVDASGRAYVSGQTHSIDFPTRRSLKSKRPLLKSSTRGLTWRNDLEGFDAEGVNSIAFEPGNPAVMLIGTRSGIYRSVDRGETWSRSPGTSTAFYITDVVYAPSNPAIVYAGATNPGGGINGTVYKSFDGGQSWTPTITGAPVFALAVNPFDPNIAYAGLNGPGGGPVIRTGDGGQNWFAQGPGSLTGINDIAINPINPSIVYATVSHTGGPMFRTTNDGASWQHVSMGFGGTAGGAIAIDPQNPSRVYAYAGGEIRKTDDGGTSWQPSLTTGGPGVPTIGVDPSDPSNVYAGMDQGLWESHDRGATWTVTNSGLVYKPLGSIAVDPSNSGVLFAANRPELERDAFVTSLNPSGTALIYSTLIGCTGPVSSLPFDFGYDLALTPSGGVALVGRTDLPNFPTTPGAYNTQSNGYWEGYVAHLDDSWTIRGWAKLASGAPLNGVSLQLSGSTNTTAQTGFDGFYKIGHAKNGGSFKLRPQKAGYRFDPPSITISDLASDQVADFTATPGVAGRAACDVDGDGKSDFCVFRPSNGTWFVLKSQTGTSEQFQFGQNDDVPLDVDFDGDLKADYSVWRPATGEWFFRNSSNGAFGGALWGTNGDRPMPADYDADGKTDFAVWRPSNGLNYIVKSTGGFLGVQWGTVGDIPSHADLNGDGKTDFAVFRPSNGTWYWLINGTSTTDSLPFGQNGDIPVTMDVDGDQKGDIAVWRPSTGEWFYRRSSNLTFGGLQWGANGDRPVPGDYDGDGRTDFATWRSTDGIHYIVRNSGGFIGVVWGGAGDVPVLGSPVPESGGYCFGTFRSAV